ncbi:NADH-quinone oxidoreductase subunit I [Verrucomicrobia bacterium LW23]|nr:NADH-quinone oxidoreductase subunit I [Verrucomicrobia bacterium LW23]
MNADYLPVLLQLIVAIGFAVGSLAAAQALGKRGRDSAAKHIAYECGKDPIGPTQPRFSVKFYMVAMLFILFDIEVVFMYTWAVVFKEQLQYGLTIVVSMFSFIGILFVGYLYVLKKGALDWTHVKKIERAPVVAPQKA